MCVCYWYEIFQAYRTLTLDRPLNTGRFDSLFYCISSYILFHFRDIAIWFGELTHGQYPRKRRFRLSSWWNLGKSGPAHVVTPGGTLPELRFRHFQISIRNRNCERNPGRWITAWHLRPEHVKDGSKRHFRSLTNRNVAGSILYVWDLIQLITRLYSGCKV